MSALHTVSAATLTISTTASTRTCLIAGDKVATKKRVADLIAQIDGLRPVNAGLLEAARLIEGLTPLLIGINSRYKTHAGINFTGLARRALVVVLAGGTGGAKLARGMYDVVGPDELT